MSYALLAVLVLAGLLVIAGVKLIHCGHKRAIACHHDKELHA